MVEGPTIMLGVFITLLCTHTMPIIYYCSTCMLLYPHLMAKRVLKLALEFEIFSWSEARNLPTWGCKSMVEGPTIMLGVFITFLCTHTMPIIYYCSTCMLLYPHLMAKRVLNSWLEFEIFSWYLRQETCQHGAVKVWWRALQSCWECNMTLLHTHTMSNIYYCSTCMLLYPHSMAKLVLRVGRKSTFFPDLRHETCQQEAVKVLWGVIEICWVVLLTLLYVPRQCQSSTIAAPACCYTPTWWPNMSKSWFNFWDFCHETCQHVAVNMLRVFIILLYTFKLIMVNKNHLHDGTLPLVSQCRLDFEVFWLSLRRKIPANMWL